MKSAELLMGQEIYLKNKYLENQKKEFFPYGVDILNYYEAEGKDVTPESLSAQVDTYPFMADKKLIVLKETGLFVPGRKEDSVKVEEILKNLPNYIQIYFIEKEVDKRGKLFKLFNQKKQYKEFKFPSEKEVIALLKNEEIHITLEDLQYFIHNMPQDLTSLLLEWDKLINFAQKGEINQSMIDEVCIFSVESQIFTLINHIIKHEVDAALQMYQQMMLRKESPIGILTLLQRQYSNLFQIRNYIERGMNDTEIAELLKKDKWTVSKSYAQAQAYTVKELDSMVKACLEADKDIKYGIVEANKRVEMLILEYI